MVLRARSRQYWRSWLALSVLVAVAGGSGRMPRQSAPDEVLASFSLARDNAVRIGSVLRPQLVTPAQFRGDPHARPDRSPVMHPALRVVGIVAAESEFPSGSAQHYDLYA